MSNRPSIRRAPAPFSRVMKLSVVLCAPAALAFILMVLSGQLTVVPALGYGLLVLIGTAMLVRLFVNDLYSAVTYIRGLVADSTPSPPPPLPSRWSEYGHEVMAASAQLARQWGSPVGTGGGLWQGYRIGARQSAAAVVHD